MFKFHSALEPKCCIYGTHSQLTLGEFQSATEAVPVLASTHEAYHCTGAEPSPNRADAKLNMAGITREECVCTCVMAPIENLVTMGSS